MNWILVEPWLATCIFLAGALFGGLICWVGSRRQMDQARERGRSETEPERAMLAERLRLQGEQLGALERQRQVDQAELVELRQELRAEVERRASAEQRVGRIRELEETLRLKEAEIEQLEERRLVLSTAQRELETRLSEERQRSEEKLASLSLARQEMLQTFRSLSSEALQANNQSFLDLARSSLERMHEMAKGDLDKRQQGIRDLVEPMRQTLDKFDTRVQELEKARTGAYEGLHQQVRSLMEMQNQLRAETGNLVKALRTPSVRGRWGELQLKRVVEMAGMLDQCSFFEQETAWNDNARVRPDLIVRLPGNRQIVVDAKVPLDGYLKAVEAESEEARHASLADHARQVRAHVTALGRKAYWEQFQPSPEFIVLFLPAESFFSAALEIDPRLIEVGVNERVLIATPTTLIALLRAVAHGWKQERVAENAEQISGLGRELYKRISDLGEHWVKLGRSLSGAVESYNRATGSLESRVLVAARRFKELEASPAGVEIEELLSINEEPRVIQAPEIVENHSVPRE